MPTKKLSDWLPEDAVWERIIALHSMGKIVVWRVEPDTHTEVLPNGIPISVPIIKLWLGVKAMQLLGQPEQYFWHFTRMNPRPTETLIDESVGKAMQFLLNQLATQNGVGKLPGSN